VTSDPNARKPPAAGGTGPLDLTGKAALVTGAGRRVGRAIALALGRAGMRVGIHFNGSRSEAEATLAALRAGSGDGALLQANLADRAAARGLVDAAVAALGGLDLIVLSAASFERVVLEDIDDDAWDRTLSLNLSSQFALAQRALPALRAARGSIVFITCSSATTPFRNHLPYVVAKGGLKHLMRTLSLEVAPDVRVNAVAPGTVLPPESLDAKVVERLAASVPLARTGSAEDVAEAVVYLARAPFVTGQEIAVDGGRSVANVERFG
jgi:pteridine reductase